MRVLKLEAEKRWGKEDREKKKEDMTVVGKGRKLYNGSYEVKSAYEPRSIMLTCWQFRTSWSYSGTELEEQRQQQRVFGYCNHRFHQEEDKR